MICQVFRSPKRDGMYLYLPASADPAELPEPLLRQFGKPEPALRLNITPERKLARADAAQVLQALNEQGYYLQMPPNPLADPAPQPRG